MRKRVVITGIGAVTPIGTGVPRYWENLLSGTSGVAPISLFDPGDYPCRIAAEVKDFDPEKFFDRKKARLLARCTQFGLAAALECLRTADWQDNDADRSRIGVAAGVSNSAQDVAELINDVVREHGYRKTLPYFLTKAIPHSTASEAGLLTGFQAQVMTVSTVCTAGLNAIGYALEEIRQGRADAFLCIGTDATITPCTLACFCRSGLVSNRNDSPARASRPFDAGRDGGVLGEGAGCILIEEAGHAARRKARVYAELLGFGTSGRGYNCNPEVSIPKGMSDAMAKALQDANCSPGQLQYVGCHGVSDPNLDAWETQALKRTLGDVAYDVPVSSVKSMIGIPQNAAGVLQLIATVKAIDCGIIPPTMNYETPDPRCDLDYVPNRPRLNRVNRALVLAHGFNGSDAAIVVGGMSSR